MTYHNFTPQQRELLSCIVDKAEYEGYNINEVTEVLSELLGCMLAQLVPTREELAELLDKTIIPRFRNITLDWHDIKTLNHGKRSV